MGLSNRLFEFMQQHSNIVFGVWHTPKEIALHIYSLYWCAVGGVFVAYWACHSKPFKYFNEPLKLFIMLLDVVIPLMLFCIL